jgi:hypothetical protein
MPETEKPCGVIVDFIQPDEYNFLTGEAITIALNVTYTNSSPLSGLNLSVGLCNTEIPLSEDSPGIYSVTCSPNSSDIGQWQVELYGVNATFDHITITVSEQPRATFEPIIGLILELCPYIITLFAAMAAGIIFYCILRWLKSRTKKRKREKEKKPKKKEEKKKPKKPEGLHKIKLG